MELIEYDFQEEAEEALYKQIAEALESTEKRTEDNETLFLSCVASGKTKMASSVANAIAKDYPDVAFMFFSPSSAQLHDNAYQEIKAYGWENLDVMTLQQMVIKADAAGSVPPGSFTAIGWSDINKKKKNVQMKEGEKASFVSVMKTNRTRIVAFYDEAHLNKTDNTKQIAELVRPFAVVNITATARKKQLEKAGHLHLVQVDTAKVVAEGKIKAHIIVNDAGMDNDDPDGGIHNDATWEGLIKAGMHRRDWLQKRFKEVANMEVVPLLTIQLPNDDTKESKDDLQTVKNAERAKEILIDNGADPDDIIIWLAGQHDEDPNNIKNTEHKYLIVKVACATGWNCPRANPLVKLRQPSQSDTLDDQTMGRFMRTVDPWEWKINPAYQDDEYLNSAFVFTSSEEYDASLQGYSIRDEQYKQTMRDEHKPKWEDVHLVKTIPGKKTFDAEDKIKAAMVKEFNKNFPANYETHGGAWVVYGDLDRNVAQVDYDVVEMMKDISEKGKATTSGHTQASMSGENIEAFVQDKIRSDGTLRRHRALINDAINKHIEEHLCYDIGGSSDFLAAPEESEEEQRTKKRNDFFKGICANFHLFGQVCRDAVNKNAEYGDTTIWDGKPGSARPMYTPPVETFTGINLKETPEKSDFAYDKQVKKAESAPEERFSVVMDNKMDSWFKNGTHEADSFLIAYIDETENNAHRKFFPDFMGIKERTLFIIEVKGPIDAQGDHAINPAQDKCKAEAIHLWENQYKTKSINESASIDKIVFGMSKEINGKWKIYQGDGEDYLDTTSDNWKLLDDVINGK